MFFYDLSVLYLSENIGAINSPLFAKVLFIEANERGLKINKEVCENIMDKLLSNKDFFTEEELNKLYKSIFWTIKIIEANSNKKKIFDVMIK